MQVTTSAVISADNLVHQGRRAVACESPDDVALRQDAIDRVAVGRDDHRAHAVVGEYEQRLGHGRGRHDRHDLRALTPEKVTDLHGMSVTDVIAPVQAAYAA